MKGLAVAALVAVVLAATATGGTDTVSPPAGPVEDTTAGPQPVNPETGLDADGLPPRIEYPGTLSHYCDEQGRAALVEPDEPRAWEAAERSCLRMNLATERAPWPDGIHP